MRTTLTESKDKENLRQCGGCGKYPPFLRRFASPQYFMFAFCMQNILQGASTSYFVGVTTSLEKHFHFTSKDIGNLIMLCEIGPITTSLIMSHLGGKGNRPRWLAMGMIISAVGLLFAFSTCLIYPPPAISESGQLSLSKKFCKFEENATKTTFSDMENGGNCYTSNNFVFFIWFMAYAFLGTGSSVVYSIGAPYLDDSIKKNDSPVYFAIIIAVKIMGPFVGFAVSAAFLKIYVTPGETHGITSLDPRWIGAWWGGTLLFCILNLIFGIVISLFPRQMSPQNPLKMESNSVHANDDLVQDDKPSEYGSIQPQNLEASIKNRKSSNPCIERDESSFTESADWISEEFTSVVRRLMENKAMVLTVLVDFFALLGIIGFFLWLPKYLEHQFRVDKAESALYTGIAGTSSVIIGVLGGGIFIRQCQPRAKTLVQICVTCKALYIVSLMGMMFITCNFNDDLPGTFDPKNSVLELHHECSSGCNCSVREFIPVCLTEGDRKGKTFFSPCHAGCPPQDGEENHHPNREFLNCTCASDAASVTSGYCERTCSAFTAYNLVNVIIKSFISVGAIGTLLINLRCVDPKDKAAALGLKGTVIALGLLVTPMVFGALADSSCIVWEEACGVRGSCWVYDTQQLGYKLHSGAALLFLASMIFEIVLSQNVNNVSLMDAVPSTNSAASRTISNSTVTSNLSSNSMSEKGSGPASIRGTYRNHPLLSSLRRSILKHLTTAEFPNSDVTQEKGHENKTERLATLPEESTESQSTNLR